MPAARGLALAAAMRVIDRVHRDAAHRRLAAEPAVPAGLADDDVLMIRVRHRADRRAAFGAHHPHLARGHPQQRIALIAADQLDISAGRAGDLTPLARLHLDIVDDRAGRDVAQRHRVARLDVDPLAGDDAVAWPQPLRRDDVGLLAIGIANEGDKGGAVRIVFKPLDDRRRVVLDSLEIDDPVAPLVTAAAPAHRDAAGVVAPALLPQALGQCLDRLAFPQFATVDDDEVALRGGGRIEGFERHLNPWA